jgi:hypothetical protein
MLGQTQRGSESMRASGVGATVARCRTCGATARAGFGPCSGCGARVDQTRAYFVGASASEFTRVCTPRPADVSADDDADAHDAAGDADAEVTQVDAVMPRERAFDATWLAMIAEAQHPSRSAAELVWDSLEGEDQTAVWSAEGASDATVTDFAPVDDAPATGTDETAAHDTAQHAIVPLRWVEARSTEPVVCATSKMPPARAALLLRLAPTGYAGSGTPVDAAVVPRDRLLDVGRACAGPWSGDPYLDALHVRLLADADGVRVIDDGSRGGVWLRIDGVHWLRDGDAFRIGEQFFAYDGPEGEAPAQLQMIDHEHRFGPAIAIDGVTVIGRVAPHVVLMHDPYVSGEHCRIVPGDDGVALEDLASSNGTWVRMRSGDLIPFGGVVAIGRSVYRVAAAEGQG